MKDRYITGCAVSHSEKGLLIGVRFLGWDKPELVWERGYHVGMIECVDSPNDKFKAFHSEALAMKFLFNHGFTAADESEITIVHSVACWYAEDGRSLITDRRAIDAGVVHELS